MEKLPRFQKDRRAGTHRLALGRELATSAVEGDRQPRCPDANTVVEFFDGVLSAAQRRAFEGHIDRCPACCALVAVLALDDEMD